MKITPNNAMAPIFRVRVKVKPGARKLIIMLRVTLRHPLDVRNTRINNKIRKVVENMFLRLLSIIIIMMEHFI